MSDGEYDSESYDDHIAGLLNNVESEKLREYVESSNQERDDIFDALNNKILHLEDKLEKSNAAVLEANEQVARALGERDQISLELKIVKSSNSSKNILSNDYKVLELERQVKGYKEELDKIGGGIIRNGLSDQLKEELNKFQKTNSLDVSDSIDLSDINETSCILLLKSASKKIKNLRKQAESSAVPRPPITGTDSELQQRILNLEEELRLALIAAEDIRALKAKITQLVGHLRSEKESKVRVDNEVKLYAKKLNILTSHIEKLMAHLKHEATAKIKFMDKLKVSETDVQVLKGQISQQARKLVAKDRLIAELREGSKVLEDQLRLMDEKYLELRTKLDWARDTSSKKIKKAEKTSADLRMKFMIMTGGNQMLDNVSLPSLTSGGGDGQFTSSSRMSASQVSWADQTSPRGEPDRSAQSTAYSKSGGSASHSKRSHSSPGARAPVSDEASLDHVLEKIRRQTHKQKLADSGSYSSTGVDWTDDKLRDLTKTR